MNDTATIGGTAVLVARQASKTSAAFGAVLTVLGVFAVMAPLFTGIAVTVLVGLLLLAGGIFEILFALRAHAFGKGVLRLLFGGLGALAGVIVIATPAESLTVLTFVLAAFFVAAGLIDFLLALNLRSEEEDWSWMMFSGIVSILLGALVLFQWPVSGAWAVGLLVGVRMLMHGWALMALGKTGQEALTHLQDTRIEMLERHMRAGAEALHETQAALADHAAMLMAFDNEIRKKVSSSEVDPAIRELNVKLGEARERMQAAAAATKEAWDGAQTEADAVFEKLRKGAAVITQRLKDEFGLDSKSPPSGG